MDEMIHDITITVTIHYEGEPIDWVKVIERTVEDTVEDAGVTESPVSLIDLSIESD